MREWEASEREAEAEERREGEGKSSLHFISVPFHSIRVFFSSSFLFFHLSSQNLASLNFSVTLFFVFRKPVLPVYLFREIFFPPFFLSSLECRTRMRMHSSANRLRRT
jgi:hypothetical protein